jgi:iron(III) transport system permease protein
VVGFAVPAAVLVGSSLRNLAEGLDSGFWKAAAVSVLVAGLVGVLTLVLSLGLAYARRVAANGFTRPAVRLASIGYAVPGTVLAIGVLIPLAALDNRLDALMRGSFGVSTGLLLSGSAFAVVLALTIRFMAVAFGVTDAGLSRISSSLDAAARTLGESAFRALRRVHLPLLRPAMGAALLIVFVDAMKELPATLLIRPANFETLAIHVYSLVHLERFEEAAAGALVIVAVGLIPVLLLHSVVASGRSGASG